MKFQFEIIKQRSVELKPISLINFNINHSSITGESFRTATKSREPRFNYNQIYLLKTLKCIQETNKSNSKSTAESVKGPSLPLESIHNIHRRDGLPPGVLSIGDGITNDILEEDLENATSLFINEAADPLNSASPRQTPNCRLSYALYVVPQHLPVTLCAALS